jgi:Protein of unknown function (DUF2958)
MYLPDAQCTWLLTELDPDGDPAFGLSDLGIDERELGYVCLLELAQYAANSERTLDKRTHHDQYDDFGVVHRSSR